MLSDNAGNPLAAPVLIAGGIPTGAELRKALADGNIGVYADIYWQHLAYQSGGIAEMERLNKQGELSDTLLNAWRLIDSGDAWKGSTLLLKYEQSITLQVGVYDKYRDAFKAMSRAAQYYPPTFSSPIPGDANNFTRCVPGGDLGNFEDRWKWIEGSMLPAWRKLVESDPEQVKEIMTKLSECDKK